MCNFNLLRCASIHKWVLYNVLKTLRRIKKFDLCVTEYYSNNSVLQVLKEDGIDPISLLANVPAKFGYNDCIGLICQSTLRDNKWLSICSMYAYGIKTVQAIRTILKVQLSTSMLNTKIAWARRKNVLIQKSNDMAVRTAVIIRYKNSTAIYVNICTAITALFLKNRIVALLLEATIYNSELNLNCYIIPNCYINRELNTEVGTAKIKLNQASEVPVEIAQSCIAESCSLSEMFTLFLVPCAYTRDFQSAFVPIVPTIVLFLKSNSFTWLLV
ncbi:MAG: hypothetical protein EXX96DRAFT_606764 [Benjaminiella poitrasii]|nr:MAG: hypothetical protein EXX96DRAFT_606764 [Benjaminiella poitrasii]